MNAGEDVNLHLSNQFNDDIKATVREDTELQVEDTRGEQLSSHHGT